MLAAVDCRILDKMDVLKTSKMVRFSEKNRGFIFGGDDLRFVAKLTHF